MCKHSGNHAGPACNTGTSGLWHLHAQALDIFRQAVSNTYMEVGRNPWNTATLHVLENGASEARIDAVMVLGSPARLLESLKQ